jgi:hypothetical protein
MKWRSCEGASFFFRFLSFSDDGKKKGIKPFAPFMQKGRKPHCRGSTAKGPQFGAVFIPSD